MNEDEYIQDDFIVSEFFIEKFRTQFNIRKNVDDNAIRESLMPSIYDLIDFILADLKNDFSKGTLIFLMNHYMELIMDIQLVKLFHVIRYSIRYLIRQLNTLITYSIFKEVASIETCIKKMVDEKTAFYLAFNSGAESQMAKFISNDNNSRGALDFVNEQHIEMIFNHNLLTKLPKGENHPFFNFQTKIIDYLKVKIFNKGFEDENINSNRSHKKQTKYLIPEGKKLELHKILNEVVLDSIDFADFIRCFDINNNPVERPRYIKRQQNLMTFTLSLIKGIDDKVALSNFGILNFYHMKNRPIPKAKRVLQNKIKHILCQTPISVTST